jgi:transposase
LQAVKAYSLDLRQRVLHAAPSGDHAIAEAARLFGGGAASGNKMLRLRRAGSNLAPRPAR